MIAVRSRIALAVLGVALALGAAPGPASADREAAGFFTQRGDRAVKERKWEEAEQHYRKALEEEEGYLPARLGLGEALHGAGRREAAIEEWRRLVALAEASPPPAGWAEVLARARKRLAEVDESGTALAAILDQQVEGLLALATKWLAKDPEVASKAVKEVLHLRPGNERALALSEKIAGGGEGWTPIFDGKSFAGWSNRSPEWSLEDGALACRGKAGAYALRSDATYSGDFDVRMEARIVGAYEGATLFSFGGGFKGAGDWTSCGIHTGALVLRDETGKANAGRELFAVAPKDCTPPFDPADWTTYELRFRGEELQIRVNGTDVASRARPAWRDGGSLLVNVQNLHVLVRKFDARKR